MTRSPNSRCAPPYAVWRRSGALCAVRKKGLCCIICEVSPAVLTLFDCLRSRSTHGLKRTQPAESIRKLNPQIERSVARSERGESEQGVSQFAATRARLACTCVLAWQSRTGVIKSRLPSPRRLGRRRSSVNEWSMSGWMQVEEIGWILPAATLPDEAEFSAGGCSR